MQELQIFNFNESQVRTLEIDNNVWFIARDVAAILGYKNVADAIKDNCKKQTSLKTLNSYERFSLEINDLRSTTLVIPESDVYRLTMRSKLPSAEQFQDWVTEEVLPSIRKTGSYSVQQFKIPKTYVEALRLAADTQEKLFRNNHAILI